MIISYHYNDYHKNEIRFTKLFYMSNFTIIMVCFYFCFFIILVYYLYKHNERIENLRTEYDENRVGLQKYERI